MAKFSSKDKIQAVKRYLEGTEGGKTIANSIGFILENFINGLNGLNFHGKRRLKNAIQLTLSSIN